MATDFFERQAAARRTTKWLVVVFALSVVLLVGTTMLAAMVGVKFGREARPGRLLAERPESFGPESYEGQIPFWAGGGAFALILGGTLYKLAELSRGGTVVAERLGGRRVYPNTTDPTEKRLLNVVEEMGLASGVPVPPVFLLQDERGINAFAAGHSPSDAVIGVTRGCAEQLSRDELQGVIAHEFSHILNGDMRLNLRMIGVLHGILLLGLVGKELLRIVARGEGRSSRKNSGALYLLAVGLALVILGFLGSLIGNLIKAAVSRQREYLADASAVQFTRNPDGISGALKRIGGAIFGSRLVAPSAAEASHMYFSTGVWEGITGLLATHPPLAERIRRLDPHWDGAFPSPREVVSTALPDGELAAAFIAAEQPEGGGRLVPAESLADAAEQVANPTEAHRRYAAALVASLPRDIVDAVHDPFGARGVIFALLLDRDADIRATQLRTLEKHMEPAVFELTLRLVKPLNRLDVRARLPLLDMSLPALRAMSDSQYRQFIHCFVALVEADRRIDIFEWTLHQILLRHLRPQFEPIDRVQVIYYGLQRLGRQISVLLSALARASLGGDAEALDAGAGRIPEVHVELLPAASSGIATLDVALRELAKVSPQHRRRLVDACAATICADGKVTVREAELLRAICDMLNCPLPPILPGQPLAAAAVRRESTTADRA